MTELLGPRSARIRAYAALKKRAERERQGRMLVEGPRLIARALEAGLLPEAILAHPDLDPESQKLLAWAPGPVLWVSERALERVSTREHPARLIGVFPLPDRRLESAGLSERPLVLVLFGLEKPGNLGAILRSADATGVDAVLVVGGTDLYSPQVIHNSTGAVFRLPVYPASEQEALDWIRLRGLTLVAASPRAERLYWDFDWRPPVALALGAEHEGLPERWMRQAQVRLRIPMRGLADSLNVSVAAALLLYEALRQRLNL
ncbi:MAG: RNA methyltransferase [Bacteroidota bacterium]|nr:RNA methyltransferase [Rhodothermia bacterium]MDW8285508.1 RNA methyltransferase [Bacteroidota bacterium]